MPRRRQKIQNASGPSKAHSWNDPSRLSGQMGLTSRLPDGCTKLISKTSFCCKTYRSRSQGEWRRTQAEELNLVGGRLAPGRRPARDRKSVVEGQSVSVRVDLGGRRIMKQKKKKHIQDK